MTKKVSVDIFSELGKLGSMTFYYIAKRKPRGRSLQYTGDGLVDADSIKEARETVARIYGVAKKNIKLKRRA